MAETHSTEILSESGEAEQFRQAPIVPGPYKELRTPEGR